MAYAADLEYARQCFSDTHVRELGGDPEEAWLGCLLMAENWAHVRALVTGIAGVKNKTPQRTGRSSKRPARHRIR